jgi:hypothetical protein
VIGCEPGPDWKTPELLIETDHGKTANRQEFECSELFGSNTNSNPAGRDFDLTAVTSLGRRGRYGFVNYFSLSRRPCTAILRLTVKKQNCYE